MSTRRSKAQPGQPSQDELEAAREALDQLEQYALGADHTGSVAALVQRVRACFFQEEE